MLIDVVSMFLQLYSVLYLLLLFFFFAFSILFAVSRPLRLAQLLSTDLRPALPRVRCADAIAMEKQLAKQVNKAKNERIAGREYVAVSRLSNLPLTQ